MILLDQPYLSDFLLNTIKKNNFELIATPIAKSMTAEGSFHWVSEEEAIKKYLNSSKQNIYTNSENSLQWIYNNLKNTKLSRQISLFKDKYQFRELVKELYPDFLFKKIKIDEIQNLNADDLKFPFVIKPSLGFFSIGVHIVMDSADWEKGKKELNYEQLKSNYPKEVMDASSFIIEEFIEGEEYAVDAYFDQNGEAVVLNILHHKFSSNVDVSDRVYSTSKNIVRENIENVEHFLKLIGAKADLKNFPLHVEIRIDKTGNIKPIEVNPLRFGGWCTTGDLAWYAFNINSYEYFFQSKKPDWNSIFNSGNDKIYSIVILDNNSGISSSAISYFDFDKIKDDFENVLEIRKVDFNKFPVFGFLFTETGAENEKELDVILNSDLIKYIKGNL